jgi:serine/threonine protein kinase
VKEQIGKGKYGQVYYGMWNGDTPVALKKLQQGEVSKLKSEADILFKLNHPCVVQVLSSFSLFVSLFALNVTKFFFHNTVLWNSQD